MTETTLTPQRRLDPRAEGVRLGPLRLRWSTLALAAVVVVTALAQGSPAALAALEFNRSAILAGQWWRLLTGHLVHYGWPHMAADMSVFVALCWIAERRSRGVLWVVLLSAAAISVAVVLGAEGITTYRGMSGVDSAVFGWVLVTMAAQDRGWKAGAWGGLLLLATVRFVLETVTGRPILPTSLPEGIAVVGTAHLVGVAVGCLMAALTIRSAVKQRPAVVPASGVFGRAPSGARWARPFRRAADRAARL